MSLPLIYVPFRPRTYTWQSQPKQNHCDISGFESVLHGEETRLKHVDLV